MLNILSHSVILGYTLDIPKGKPEILEVHMLPTNLTNPKSLRRDQLVVEDLGTELMIYDQQRNKAFCLNQKAAFVWQHCDGNTSVAEIATLLAQSTDEVIDQKMVQFALQSLSQDGLLEPSTFEPVAAVGMTRREVMQKIGIRTAVALPLVTALMVATPRAHASGKSSTGGKPPKRHY
jgi:hypothetical protein